MTDLNDLFYTDGLHDVLAAYVNRILAATLRSEYKNVEVLAADKELTDADTPIQNYDGDGSNWVVKVPVPDAVENHAFLIVNASGATEVFTLKSNDGVITYGTVDAGEAGLLLPDGAGNYIFFSSGGGGGGGADENAVTSLIMAFG